MSDLSPSEQALIDSGEYMYPRDIVQAVKAQVPRVVAASFYGRTAEFVLDFGKTWYINFAIYVTPKIYPSSYIQSAVMELNEFIRREGGAS